MGPKARSPRVPRLVPFAAAVALLALAPPLAAQPYVYVTDPSANALTVVDSSTNAVVRTLQNLPGADAVAVKPDGTRVYVTEPTKGNIAVFDGTKIGNPNSDPLITEIDIGGQPTALALSPDEKTLYVADAANNQAEAVTLASGTIANTYAAGTGVTSLALSPDGHLLAIGANDKTITFYAFPWQAGTGTVKTSIGLGSVPKAMTFDASGGVLWVATGAGYASYNRASGTIEQFAQSGGTTSVAYDVRQGLVYFGASSLHRVYVLMPGATGLQQIGVFGPVSGLALSADGTRLYATQNCSNCGLAVIDTSQQRALAQIHFGTAPATLGQFVGPGPIVAANEATTASAGVQFSSSVVATDGNGRALTYALLATPTHGSLDLNATGDFTYTPSTAYSGLQSFVWQASATGGPGAPTLPRSRPVTESLVFLPTVSAIPDQTADPGSTVGPLAFTLAGSEPLAVSITSTASDVVNPKNVTVGSGCGTISLDCTLTIDVGNASGSNATVSVNARDPGGFVGVTSFKVSTSGIGPGHSSLTPLTLFLLVVLGSFVMLLRRRHGAV